jgi:hypothetical protein
MKPSACPAKERFRGTAFILAFIPILWGQAPTRTLFKDMPPADPRREVIQSVLDSPLEMLRARFPGREWVAGGYRDAWDRVRRYFPASAYYVEPGTYFMTHGFGPDGRLFMEIHDSAYLSLSVADRRTFTDGSIVGEYGRMLGAAGGGEAAAFREKTGRLESYFRDEASKKRLRKILGEALYSRLLGGLRQENAHMFAGGLMHEGIHAGMDGEEIVARIQAEFKGGGLAVQWDELRAFMAEAVFQGSFYRWAVNDIAGGGNEVEARLEMLETLRGRPRLVRAPDREKFERTAAGIGAAAALVRLRMRELWQSAQRLEGLVVNFQKDYLKPDPPPGVEDLMKKLAGDIDGFVESAGESIRRTELALRRLEEVLGQWDEWAAALRPFPPPVTDSKDILAMVGKAAWPSPPAADTDRLKKLAERELAKVGGNLLPQRDGSGTN